MRPDETLPQKTLSEQQRRRFGCRRPQALDAGGRGVSQSAIHRSLARLCLVWSWKQQNHSRSISVQMCCCCCFTESAENAGREKPPPEKAPTLFPATVAPVVSREEGTVRLVQEHHMPCRVARRVDELDISAAVWKTPRSLAFQLHLHLTAQTPFAHDEICKYYQRTRKAHA